EPEMARTKAKVPTCIATSVSRNMPRCPPASAPWAMIASTPCSASHSTSRRLVAQPRILQPVALTRASSGFGGRPKWKVNISGRSPPNRGQSEVHVTDLGAQRLYRSAVSLAEWRVTCRKRKRRRLNAKLGEVGRDALEPCPILCEIRRRYSVAEEIEVERLVAARPELSPTGANLIRAKRGAKQRPEPARLGNGDGEIDAGEIGHRRRDDRQLDAEQIEQSRVTPNSRNHHFPVGSWRLPRRRRRSALSLMK